MEHGPRIVAGLGNPGSSYAGTRHNIGFELVDRIASRSGASWKREGRFLSVCASVQIGGVPMLLIKPNTYMNRSGEALAAIARFYKWTADRFVVAYDEINLDPGRTKLTTDGSAGGHNGIADILGRLGDGFFRLRIGVGGRPDRRIDLKEWVLGRFRTEERPLVDGALDRAETGLEILIGEGPVRAMEFLNRKATN